MLSSPGTAFPLSTAAAMVLAVAALMHFSPLRWRDAAMRALSGASEWKTGVAFVGMLYVAAAFTQQSGGFIYFRF